MCQQQMCPLITRHITYQQVCMGGVCKYTCNTWRCCHEWCSQNHFTQMMMMQDDNDDATAWFHILNWPPGQICPKKIPQNCNLPSYCHICVSNKYVPLMPDICYMPKLVNRHQWGSLQIYLQHMNSLTSTMWWEVYTQKTMMPKLKMVMKQPGLH